MRDEDPLQEETVFRLSKVTLEYRPLEDRLQLSGEDTRGKKIKLWLTFGILNRLVPYLVRWRRIESTSFDSPEARFSCPSTTSDSVGPAVFCDPESPEVLVRAIGLQVVVENMVLIFKDMSNLERASLTLSAEVQTDWTQGLKQCFDQAGWPQAAFLFREAIFDAGFEESVTIH